MLWFVLCQNNEVGLHKQQPVHLYRKRFNRYIRQSMVKIRGKVKFFDTKKGWGFIDAEGIECAVFVHHSALRQDGFRKLKDSEIVDFELETDDNSKTFATNVERVLI